MTDQPAMPHAVIGDVDDRAADALRQFMAHGHGHVATYAQDAGGAMTTETLWTIRRACVLDLVPFVGDARLERPAYAWPIAVASDGRQVGGAQVLTVRPRR